MPRAGHAAVALAALALALPARAQEAGLASDEELRAELAAREADIARTGARAAALEAEASKDAAGVDRARMELLEADTSLARRAGFLYRLGRRGASFRYLLGAPSAAAFLKRYATLRRLVVGMLVARREAGERLAEAEAALSRSRSELQSARSMLSQLEEARLELLAEEQRRLARTLVLR